MRKTKPNRFQVYTTPEIAERVEDQARRRFMTPSQYLNSLIEKQDSQCRCPPGWAGCPAHGYVGGKRDE